MLESHRFRELGVALRVRNTEDLLWSLTEFCDLYFKSSPLDRVTELV